MGELDKIPTQQQITIETAKLAKMIVIYRNIKIDEEN